MIFKLKDYLDTLNRDCHQWYGWSVLEGDNEKYENILVHDANAIKPSAQECIDAVADMQKKWDDLAYARNRQAEYPTIQELVVALYDTDDKSAVEVKRAAVKSKYPKP